MTGLARHPVTTFALVFGLIVVVDVILDGQIEFGPAVFGALGAVVGASLLEWLRRKRRS